MKIRSTILLMAAAGTLTATAASQRMTAATELSAYVAPANRPSVPDITFMPDGTRYAQLSDDNKKIVVKDIATGKEVETLFDLDRTRETTIPSFDGYALSPDASRVLVWRNAEAIYRRSFMAEYYVYEVRSRLLRPLSANHKVQRDPLFSPDSRMVAFVAADNNIYIAKLDYQTEVAATTDGVAGAVINGAVDWTYEEEFTTTSLMTWAPDCLTFCYVRSDESAVPTYTLPIYEGTCPRLDRYALYPGIFSYKYPVAGQPNATVSVHSYDIETRKTKTVDIPGDAYYIPRIAYGPKPSQLMVSTLNRDQNRYEIFAVNPKSTVSRSVYVDESRAWIEPIAYEQLYLGDDYFAVASDIDGHTRYYQYSYAGAKIKAVTPAGVDATDYYGSDAAGNCYFCTASPTPMDRTVQRLDQKGAVTALSATGGTSEAYFAPGCRYMLLKYSNITMPPTYTLNRADGKAVTTLCDNAAYAAAVAQRHARREFFTFTADGNTFNGYIVKPSDFSASKRYPVIMSQYSGPGSQSVLNKWSFDWEDYFVSHGYIVACVDGRGTGGRGAQWRTAVYKDLGNLETVDQVSAARYVGSLPYVDASRIGIYGWSYGGYEALMCASADGCPYAAAVAVAPVTDWRYYDTVYTERYMRTPAQNEHGYNSSSAILRATHLDCPLLIMYGTEDDNVHPANSLQYVSTLQSMGGVCDMFVFPNKNHSINGCNARAMVYARMLKFFDDKM